MATGPSDGIIMTDRALAIADGKQDIDLMMLVDLLRESADSATLTKVHSLQRRTLELSQRDELCVIRLSRSSDFRASGRTERIYYYNA